MIIALVANAFALVCTGLDLESCEATNAILAQLERQSPGTVADDAARVRLRPDSIYAAVDEVRQAGTLNGCDDAEGAVVLGTEAGLWTGRPRGWSGEWAAIEGGDVGTVAGTYGSGRWMGTFDGSTTGDYGQIEARYTRTGQVIGDRGAGQFSAGGWVRTTGRNGIWYSVYGMCEADYRLSLGTWFDEPLAADDDGDGVVASDDCDDSDALTYPGATEVCDGRRNDCDDAAWTINSEPVLTFEPTDGGDWENLTLLPSTTTEAGRWHVCGDVSGPDVGVRHDTEVVGERAGERPTVAQRLSVLFDGIDLTLSDVTVAGSAGGTSGEGTFRATRTTFEQTLGGGGTLLMDDSLVVGTLSFRGRVTIANSALLGRLDWWNGEDPEEFTSTMTNTTVARRVGAFGGSSSSVLRVVNSSIGGAEASGTSARIEVFGGAGEQTTGFLTHFIVSDNGGLVTMTDVDLDWEESELVRLNTGGAVVFDQVSTVQPDGRVRFFDGTNTTFETVEAVGGLFDFVCTEGVGCVASDADGDGVIASLDCDDADATTFPGAVEICDGKQNDCDAMSWSLDSEPTVTREFPVGTFVNLANLETDAVGAYTICDDLFLPGRVVASGVASFTGVGVPKPRIFGRIEGASSLTTVRNLRNLGQLLVTSGTMVIEDSELDDNGSATPFSAPGTQLTLNNVNADAALIQLQGSIDVVDSSLKGRIRWEPETLEVGAITGSTIDCNNGELNIADGDGTSNASVLTVMDSTIVNCSLNPTEGTGLVVQGGSLDRGTNAHLYMVTSRFGGSAVFNGTSVDWGPFDLARIYDLGGSIELVDVPSTEDRQLMTTPSSTHIVTTVSGEYSFFCDDSACTGSSVE